MEHKQALKLFMNMVNNVEQYPECENIIDALRSLNSAHVISDDDYDYIIKYWDDIIEENIPYGYGDKQSVTLMFYPINWERHVFDGMNTEQIIEYVRTHEHWDVWLFDWGEHDMDEDGDCVVAELDCDLFNNWNERNSPDSETQLYLMDSIDIGESYDKNEEFILSHWCVALQETIDNINLKINS